MKFYSKKKFDNPCSLDLVSLILTSSLILIFILSFPVPPLVDFLAFIGLSLGYLGGGYEYFVTTPL